MKTTIDIPENELMDAIRYTNAKTKREAIVTAVRSFDQRLKHAEIAKKFGTCETFITQAELLDLRKGD